MKKRKLCAALALTGIMICFARANAVNDRESLLGTLKHGHPRLISLKSDEARVLELIRTNPEAKALYLRVKAQADGLLSEPETDFTAADYRDNIVRTKVLLGKMRECLDRVYTLLTIYRLDHDSRYLERAKRELMNVAALKDWNRMHFLDTAEITHAFAIGYDWMYNDLSEQERSILRKAMIEKGLKQGLSAYRADGKVPWGYWVHARHNWNQVCNGGMVLGALAIADEDPKLAEEILEHALKSIRLPMAEFAPDGAWAEGPAYWSYATQYNVFLLAGLKSALGTDLGLAATPGFSRTGMFPIYYTGPLGLTFNYADAGDKSQPDEQMFWLAREYDQPVFAWHEKQYLDRIKAVGLWWLDTRWDSPAELPLDAYFRGAELAFLRSAWQEPDALFVGFKGGDNHANHSHLDLGSFVFDALGVRWAVDLGKDSYKLPLYFDTYLGSRWRYYRLRTESHNTLLIDGNNQGRKAKAAIIKFHSSPDRAIVITDLTEAYGQKAKSVKRGLAMVDRSRVIVQDEIETRSPARIGWGFLTGAEITLKGQSAVLAQKNANLLVRIVEPPEAAFKVVSAFRPPPENPNEGINNLTVQLPKKVSHARIVVELIPYRGLLQAPAPKPVVPLAEWK